jgi:hypothetical protein
LSTEDDSSAAWKETGSIAANSPIPLGGVNMVNEDDDWSESGKSILSQENLEKFRHVLKEEGPLIIEHRLYRRSSAPQRLIFDEYDELIGYLQSRARPGDSFYAWSYVNVCNNENTIAMGKYPDDRGRTPKRGAY